VKCAPVALYHPSYHKEPRVLWVNTICWCFEEKKKNSGGSQPFVHDHGHRNIRHVTIRKGFRFCDVINRLFTPNLISNAYGQLWRDIEFLLL